MYSHSVSCSNFLLCCFMLWLPWLTFFPSSGCSPRQLVTIGYDLLSWEDQSWIIDECLVHIRGCKRNALHNPNLFSGAWMKSSNSTPSGWSCLSVCSCLSWFQGFCKSWKSLTRSKIMFSKLKALNCYLEYPEKFQFQKPSNDGFLLCCYSGEKWKASCGVFYLH